MESELEGKRVERDFFNEGAYVDADGESQEGRKERKERRRARLSSHEKGNWQKPLRGADGGTGSSLQASVLSRE